jgi:GNAT superfamily N-acetyltransferase
MDIVRATPDLAGALTGISLAAKRHWNYPESWIEAWKPQLTITSEYVAASPTYAALEEGAPVGFYALVLWPAAAGELRAQLDHLWLRPDWIGRGLGRTLFEHAVASARQLGCGHLFLEAEPNAEPFYRHMGARRTGERIGEIEGQARVLPLMELDLGSHVSHGESAP